MEERPLPRSRMSLDGKIQGTPLGAPFLIHSVTSALRSIPWLSHIFCDSPSGSPLPQGPSGVGAHQGLITAPSSPPPSSQHTLSLSNLFRPMASTTVPRLRTFRRKQHVEECKISMYELRLPREGRQLRQKGKTPGPSPMTVGK